MRDGRTGTALFKVQTIPLFTAVLCLGSVVPISAQKAEQSVPDQLTVSIDLLKTGEPVSKYEFGMFIEHLRGLIYRSLWAEMLDDRKFYFPISSKDADTPVQPQGGGSFRNMRLRKWRPIGPDETVVMDKDRPFVGDQSPRIELDSAISHGIQQSGLVLVKDKNMQAGFTFAALSARRSKSRSFGAMERVPGKRFRSTHSQMNTKSFRSVSLHRQIPIMPPSK